MRGDLLAARYYERLPPGTLSAYVPEPESREWAYTFARGRELVFVRKRRADEVEGFVELYHSVGRFEEPTSWEGMRGWDFVVDVDLDVDVGDPVGFAEGLGRALKVAVEVHEVLHSALGFPSEPWLVNFSGSKGFHVRYRFEDVRFALRWEENVEGRRFDPGEFVSRVGRFVAWLLNRELPEDLRGGEDVVDDSMYEPKRLIRCVGSINAKTYLPAVPVWSWEDGSWEAFARWVRGRGERELGAEVLEKALNWPGEGCSLLDVLRESVGVDDVGEALEVLSTVEPRA